MPTSIEQNKALVLRQFECWNTGNLAIADETIAADYKSYDFDTPREGRGPESERSQVTMYRAAFPDLHLTIEEMIAADDVVVSRWRATGTHTGEFLGMPPTGTATETTGVTISRIANGKLVEDRVFMDSLKLMQAIGAIPA